MSNSKLRMKKMRHVSHLRNKLVDRTYRMQYGREMTNEMLNAMSGTAEYQVRVLGVKFMDSIEKIVRIFNFKNFAILGIIIVVVLFTAGVLQLPIFSTMTEDEHTQELCREWAAADHSGSVPRARYEWLGGDEYWNNFDWYGSCMLNNGRKVAE